MDESKGLLTLLDRVAAGTHTPKDLAALRHLLAAAGPGNTVQLGRYNVEIGHGQDIQIGDRIYHGVDADAIQRAIRAVLDEYHPAAPGRPQVYHNLPHPAHSAFIGRQAELAQALAKLRPYPHSQSHVVLIDGIGGIGKSALALEIGHYYLREFEQLPEEERFRAIVWTSAKAATLTADGPELRQQIVRTLADIYSAIAGTLDRQDLQYAQPAEQDRLVNRVLTQQRTLLIVDNLETIDDEQVIAFIRELPAPTKCVVTTRHRIDVAYALRLAGMPEAEGRALIAQESQARGVELSAEQAGRLYQRTGGVPLAIVWSMAQIGYGYEIEQVLRRLGTPSDDVARYCFEGATARIRGQPAHKLLMALSLFAADASREALGVVADLPQLDRDEGLVVLERLSLVNRWAGRFSLLPLTRGYAQNELRGLPTQQEMERRWIDYLKGLCGVAAGEDFWRWLNQAAQQDGANIVAATDWAYRHGSPDDVLVLTKGACWYLETTGRWREEIEYAQRALQLAPFAEDPLAAARVLTSAGWIVQQWGDYTQAEKMFQEALGRYEAKGSTEGRCVVLQLLALVFRKRGQFGPAAELCDQAYRLAAELESGDLQALVRNERGKLARDMGDWAAAREHFAAVQEWFESRTAPTPRDDDLAFGNIGQLAWVDYHLGRLEESRSLFSRALDLFAARSKGYTATLRYRLALVEEALGRPEQAGAQAGEAAYWFERIGMQHDLEEAQALLARLQATPNQRAGTLSPGPG